jgi:hypothetical protein
VRLVRLAVMLSAAVGLLAGPVPLVSPARASCVTVPSIEIAVANADIVFVGTVVALENLDRWATVDVKERWRGASGLGPTVSVHGGAEPGVASTVDRTFQRTTYLFLVKDGPGYLLDDACTATTAWSDDLARLRPAGVAPASSLDVSLQEKDTDISAPVAAAILFAALAIAVASYLLILRARLRPPDWMR